MSEEPPKGDGNKPAGSGKSRRRRRRRRPKNQGQGPKQGQGQGQGQGQAQGQGQGQAQGQGRGRGQGQGEGRRAPQPSGDKPKSKRPRRRRRKPPREQSDRSASERANVPREQSGKAPERTRSGQKAKGGKPPSRRRRRRRGPRQPSREPRPAGQPPPEEAEESLAFPDEEAWDLEDSETPPKEIPPAPPSKPALEDADDLVLELGIDEDAPPAGGDLRNVVLVRLRDRSSVQSYEAGESNLERGDRVVVETEQGLAIGSVARRSMRTQVTGGMPRLMRRIDSNDMRQETRNASREQEAFDLCRERILARKLPMKLIRVEYLHGGNKAIFFFSAEHRVDFRDLVKDLAQRLHTRIVMRQVGVRDEAKMTGGIGSCGMPLCCAGWLPKFEPVSIRMAKDQNLVLNPQKVSGQCGRLKCCLTYEQDLYREARRKLPKTGRMVRTPDGEGRVQEVDILRGIVRVSLTDGKVQHYSAEQLEQPSSRPPPAGK